MKKRVLFLIPSLAHGGAEKVLVNLVNNMDSEKHDITIAVLFPGGVNENFLKPHIRVVSFFKKPVRGISFLLTAFSPKTLHKLFIREEYDIEVSYHEGIAARIISGCSNPHTKTIAWIHVEQHTSKKASFAFRSKTEAERCYNAFDRIVCVSDFVRKDFSSIFNLKKTPIVLYNTVESDLIKRKSTEKTTSIIQDDCVKLIAVGTLKPSKGYERLFRIIKRLREEGQKVKLYVLGEGEQERYLRAFISENGLQDSIILLGYDTNP